MLDVVALGEILIDFTVVGPPEEEWRSIRGSAGGAPANVLAALCRLGGSGRFIGKVGNDTFGDYLQAALQDVGIDTSGLLHGAEETTLAFVALGAGGERNFSFQRNPGADTQLRSDELVRDWFQNARVFHFGSLSLTSDPARKATWEAVKMARDAECVVSFDPNLRPPLWRDLNDAKPMMLEGIRQADIVKLADDELAFLTGEEDIARGLECIRMTNSEALYLVTRGAKGVVFSVFDEIHSVEPHKVNAVDTTAAGDAFLGTFLYALTHMSDKGVVDPLDLALRDVERLRRYIEYANVAGALTTTRRGAFSSLPTLDEIKTFL